MQPRFNLKRDIRDLVYKYASDEYEMNDEILKILTKHDIEFDEFVNAMSTCFTSKEVRKHNINLDEVIEILTKWINENNNDDEY